MATDIPEQPQALPTYMNRGMLLAPLALAIGFGSEWLLPAEVAIPVGIILIVVGIAASFRSSTHTVPTRRDHLATLGTVVGLFVLINHLSFRWLPVFALVAGIVMLAKWPLIVRKNPAARSTRNDYLLASLVIMTFGIPILIAEAGMDWQRPVLSCFALLPLAGWGVALVITSVRMIRSTPAPDGVDAEIYRMQVVHVEQTFSAFFASLPFIMTSIVVLGFVSGLMYYGSVRVGAVVAAALLLVSIELFVRTRRIWSERRIWLILGVGVGSLSAFDIASDHPAISVALLLIFLALVVDAISSGLGRPMHWNVVPAKTFFDVLMFLIAPTASITAAVVRLAESL